MKVRVNRYNHTYPAEKSMFEVIIEGNNNVIRSILKHEENDKIEDTVRIALQFLLNNIDKINTCVKEPGNFS